MTTCIRINIIAITSRMIIAISNFLILPAICVTGVIFDILPKLNHIVERGVFFQMDLGVRFVDIIMRGLILVWL
jgi:hypothetical protein